MSTYESIIGAETVQEIAAALCKAAGGVFAHHGNDPNSGAILAAGFVMALRSIGENIDRRVPIVVRAMLEDFK